MTLWTLSNELIIGINLEKLPYESREVNDRFTSVPHWKLKKIEIIRIPLYHYEILFLFTRPQ